MGFVVSVESRSVPAGRVDGIDQAQDVFIEIPGPRSGFLGDADASSFGLNRREKKGESGGYRRNLSRGIGFIQKLAIYNPRYLEPYE